MKQSLRIATSIAIAMLVWLPMSLGADRPLREARSENSHYLLRIKPGQRGARPEAALYLRTDKSRRERPVWETKLVNEVSPVRAFIRDDGKFVVTIDEFQRGGAAHSVVVYDQQGRVLREMSLRELLTKSDWENVHTKDRQIDWSDGAGFRFKGEEPKFVIRLRWGREVEIDLSKADRKSSDSQPTSDDAQEDIPPEIAALLNSGTNTADRPEHNAAFYEALNKLIEMEIANSGGEFPFEKMPDLVRVAEDLSKGLPQQTDATAGDNVTIADASDASQTAETLTANAANDGMAVENAGVSAAVGVPIPMPDARDHTDYLAWVNDYTVTESASAQPIYQELIDASPETSLDDELLAAALRGDPEALANPQVSEWLAANAEALRLFKEAPGYDYRGWHLEASDGVLLSAILPALGKVRQTSRAAIIEAKKYEAEGQVGPAIDDYMTTLEVGGQQGAGVTLIEGLVGHAVQGLAAEGLLDMMAGPQGDNIDYDDLSRRIEQSYIPVRPMPETIQFERAMVLDLVQRAYVPDPETGELRVGEMQSSVNLLALLEPDETKRGEMAESLANVGFDNMVTDANEAYDKLTRAAEAPFQQANAMLDGVVAEMRDPEYASKNKLLSEMVPALSRAEVGMTRGEATRRATRLVAELRAYQKRYGAYPESLAAFGGAGFSVDPFSGQPFRYEPTADGFRLYSVGVNGADDAGVHDGSAATNDVVYWPRPKR